MRVLVTGAAGVLGSAVVGMLREERGIVLRLTDRVPADVPGEFVRADLCEPEQVAGLCEDVDEVMHIAAIHPWKQYTPQQYIDCNIKATWNVLQEAARAKVRRVIYTSSIAAMGYTVADPQELPFDESKPCRPVEDIYGVTKRVGEQFCEMVRATAGLSYVAMRPGCFIPGDEMSAGRGFGLLSFYVHRSDVARAHVLALKSEVRDEAIIVMPDAPFTRADAVALREDAPPVLLTHFPKVAQLERHGIALPGRLDRCYSIAKAKRLLGYAPWWNFADWLEKKLAQ
jgi:nucleoside-diphosphate-sugar epimerase